MLLKQVLQLHLSRRLDGVNLIANNIKGSTIASLARCVADDIDQAWEAIKLADKSRIHVFTSTSDIHMEHMLRKTKEEVLKMLENL